MEKSIIFLFVKILHMYWILTNILQIKDLFNRTFETYAAMLKGEGEQFSRPEKIVKSYTAC